ncbi:MAG: glycosyltransferase family 2 protein [Leptolyngbyaceae cyanobacterium CRU_2_3]|nr:glycosyltransferase family 2 protein [Leptolyngbyaceae cyanobacterium CRU_2_3]
MPLVSVVIPMYNAEAFISGTLDSILQEQTVDLEVIVVNDGSTDGSLNKVLAVQDHRIRVVDGPGKGISASLNTGLAAVQSDIVMRCDADDQYPVGRISAQVDWLSKHPDYGAVCGGFSTLNTNDRLITQFQPHNAPQEITHELQNGITSTHFCTFAVRTQVLRAIEGCRHYFKTAEDIDVQLRIGEMCRVYYLPEVFYQYRLHDASITHIQSNSEREFFSMIAVELQRQRRLQGSDDIQRGCPPALPQSSEKEAMKAGEHIQQLLIHRAWQEHQAGQKIQALSTAARSVMTQPMTITAWSNLLALCIKPSGQKKNLKSDRS